MPLRNTTLRYGAVAMTLHWLIAAMILGLIVLGWVMVQIPDAEIAVRYRLYQLHKSLGFTVLLLAALRLGWRLINPVPPLPGGLKPYERRLARATHGALYALMLAVPVAGWIMVSASPFPTGLVFGLFAIPDLLAADGAVQEIAFEVHENLAWLFLPVLALHVAGALKHHFVLKDDVLRRMLPFTRVPRSRSRPAGD